MPPSARLFLCARCRAQVLVCSRCDRGQIYCAEDCSQTSRRACMREAGRRYQLSRRGRFAHAERMRRYRSRQKEVTHQASAGAAPDVLLPLNSATPDTISVAAPLDEPAVPRCCFCHRACSSFVRIGPLRRRVLRPHRTGSHRDHWP